MTLPLQKDHLVPKERCLFNPSFLLLGLNNVSDKIPLPFLSAVREQVLGIICEAVNTLHEKIMSPRQVGSAASRDIYLT